jgi:hypothetical protein
MMRMMRMMGMMGMRHQIQGQNPVSDPYGEVPRRQNGVGTRL